MTGFCQYHTTYKDEYGQKIGESDTRVVPSSRLEPVQQQIISSYVPSVDPNLLLQAGAIMQKRYEENRKYLNSLLDWVLQLKKVSTDYKFTNTLDIYYTRLRSYAGTDVSYDKLNAIEMDLKLEVSNFQNSNKLNSNRELTANDYWKSGNENFKKNKFQQAIQDFTKVIEIAPEFTDSYHNRGWAKYYVKDYIGALADFNKQIELTPDSYTAYYNRGSAKSLLGDYYGSINDYTKSIELKPDYSMAYNNRGYAKFKQKKYVEALEDLNKSIVIDPNNDVAYDSRAETKFVINDINGCINDCNKALEINPKLANSYFIRGKAYQKQGDKTNACENWSKAGELGEIEAYELITKFCNN